MSIYESSSSFSDIFGHTNFLSFNNLTSNKPHKNSKVSSDKKNLFNEIGKFYIISYFTNWTLISYNI